MNHKPDSSKKSIVEFLIKYVLLLSIVLLSVNLILFGVFCYVIKEGNQKEIGRIDIENTPLSFVMDEVEVVSKAMQYTEDNEQGLSEIQNKKIIEALAYSDDNILNVKYKSKKGTVYLSNEEFESKSDEYLSISNLKYKDVNISAPQVAQYLNEAYVVFTKKIENTNGELQGNLEIYYRFDAFKTAIRTTISGETSSQMELIYTKEFQYRVVDQLTYMEYFIEILKSQSISIVSMLVLLTLSCCFFVNSSYKTLKQLVLDLDRNYRKNVKGVCIIEEYHIIMALLDEIKVDIDQKMLRSSELKVIENELISNLRYQTKQFDALFKNHTVLKERDLYLSAYFRIVSNNVDQMIWLMDAGGKIKYVNEILEETLKFENNKLHCEHISEFLEGFEKGLGILLERDYKAIRYTFKNHIFNESLNGSAVRIREFNKVNYVLCICSKSNFEDKMNHNYLKKSRDLHFINEIGKIISINNNIEVTLQEILDKVAFLANLNSSTIRLVNERQKLELKTVSGYSTEYVLESEIPIEGRHMGYCFKENRIILINHKEDLLFQEPVLEKLLDTGRSIAYIPLANYQKSFGVMSIIGDFQFNTDYMVLLESISINVTISLEKVLLYDQLKANYFKTVEAFVTAAEIKQERFSGHSRRVASICRLIAERLYLSENEIDGIYIAGLLHDVGKLGFADNSLEYFFDIEHHGLMGRKMIENVGFDKEILEGIEFHHLNYDLSNQTLELKEQPYYSQIIRLANDFDLFMNYNGGVFDHLQFITKMNDESGSVYSPQLIKILDDLIENRSDALKTIYDFSDSGEYYEN